MGYGQDEMDQTQGWDALPESDSSTKGIPLEPAAGKGGGGCRGIALGCLGTMLLVIIVMLAGAWWIVKKRHDFVRVVIDRGIRESDLLDADKETVMRQIDRLVDGYTRGKVDLDTLQSLGTALEPLTDLLMVRAAQVKYMNGRGRAPQDKADAERIIQRLMRGVIEKSISRFTLEDALNIISSTTGNGGRAFRDSVTPLEITSFLDKCSHLVEEASIPGEDYSVDVGTELKKRVDEALEELAEAPAE